MIMYLLRRWRASCPCLCAKLTAAAGNTLAHPPPMLIAPHRSRSASSRTRRGGPAPAFELLDEDIEEKFVKGSGPGGQKINKVRNCVQLTHIPSGLSVSCQDSRELHANRQIARKRLQEKVEFSLRGEDSKVGRRINKIRNKKARSQRRARLKHQGAAAAAAATAAAAAAAAEIAGQQGALTRDGGGEARARAVTAADSSSESDDDEEWVQEYDEEDDDDDDNGGSSHAGQ